MTYKRAAHQMEVHDPKLVVIVSSRSATYKNSAYCNRAWGWDEVFATPDTGSG